MCKRLYWTGEYLLCTRKLSRSRNSLVEELLCGYGGRHDRSRRQKAHRMRARLMRKTYKYRIYPNKETEQKFNWVLTRCRELYNAALSERKDAYKYAGKSVTYYDQQNDLPEIKAEIREEYQAIAAHVLQDVLRRLDKAFQNFFRRLLNGENPGYPRFQGRNRYDSFTYPDGAGWKLTREEQGKKLKGTLHHQRGHQHFRAWKTPIGSNLCRSSLPLDERALHNFHQAYIARRNRSCIALNVAKHSRQGRQPAPLAAQPRPIMLLPQHQHPSTPEQSPLFRTIQA